MGVIDSRLLDATMASQASPDNNNIGRCVSQERHQCAPPEVQACNSDAEKCVISWTGGKDCNLALLIAWRDPTLNVVALVVFRPEDAEFKAHPLSLMEAQASSLGLPLLHVTIPRDAPSYKDAYVRGMVQLKEAKGVAVIATGDMDLVGSMSRNWIEECCEAAGLRAFLPLWQSDREANLRRLLDERFVILFSCVKAPWFDKSWIGRYVDETTLAEMKAKAAARPGPSPSHSDGDDAKPLDLGGERGEYHTMCVDGPLFAHAVSPPLKPARELSGEPGQKEGVRWWTLAV